MHRILVLGAGFAGLWSAVAAARRLDELGAGPDEVEVLVVNRTAWHSVRVRNYEADLDATLVPLADVLDPIGIKHIVAEVTDIYAPERKVACTIDGASQLLAYDRLVFALGSCLAEPAIPGLLASRDRTVSKSRNHAHCRARRSRSSSRRYYRQPSSGPRRPRAGSIPRGL